jgi:hypothetical protein
MLQRMRLLWSKYFGGVPLESRYRLRRTWLPRGFQPAPVLPQTSQRRVEMTTKPDVIVQRRRRDALP